MHVRSVCLSLCVCNTFSALLLLGLEDTELPHLYRDHRLVSHNNLAFSTQQVRLCSLVQNIYANIFISKKFVDRILWGIILPQYTAYTKDVAFSYYPEGFIVLERSKNNSVKTCRFSS